MKSKKPKLAKTGCSKKKVPSDVSPSTSLPPLVEGQLRCFLRVTISRVLWTVNKPPPTTFFRLRWWGESSNGTHFYPRDGSQVSQKVVKTTARFPIRCGPKQFTSYLTDMGSLVLEALTKSDHLPVARAQVAGISHLSLSNSISGFYTLVSPTSEKLGELQVSLSLEPLTEAYESSSSLPMTDISVEVPQVTAGTVPSSRPLPVNSVKEAAGSNSGHDTPRGKDHVYFQNVQTDKGKEESLENQAPKNDAFPPGVGQQSHNGQTSNDILSVILERGSKLRNAMVVSALNCDLDSDFAVKEAPLAKDSILQTSKLHPPPPSGTFLHNILHTDPSLQHSTIAPDYMSTGSPADVENVALELLLGSLNTSPLPLWNGLGSSCESLSGHSSVCVDSDLNDPQYDQSLLENLFYKTPMSDVTLDNTEVDDGKTSGETPQTKKSSRTDKTQKHSGPKKVDLSLDQLTVIHGVQLARVTVHTLTLPTSNRTNTSRYMSIKGKPPRPHVPTKCSYFVEYVFPIASSTGRRDDSQAGEVTRVYSNKLEGVVVKFQRHFEFPVHINATAVEWWWRTDLIFSIFSKNNHKKAEAVGKAVYPLKCLLEREQLSHTIVLPVLCLEGTGEHQEMGKLKVSLELAADSHDIVSSKSVPAERARSPLQTAASPPNEASPRSQHADRGARSPASRDIKLDVRLFQGASPRTSPHAGLNTSPHRPQRQMEEDYEVLLHVLLMVQDGKNFHPGTMQSPNFYLNCKLFGADENMRSALSWGQTNPTFNFTQVTPVALTAKFLERMKNNLMVIEVWQRTGSSGQDSLYGLVKLPLHQFYMSFRDPKIMHLLLQAQYPVLGVDCYQPVMDVFSGSCKGNLRVLLAVGQSDQILALQHTRDEEFASVSHFTRPVHLLDHLPYSKASPAEGEALREHVFVLRVEKVEGLTPLQSTVWGEADCYIQYTFPAQDGGPCNLDPNLIESSVNLKQFRTATTLCVPDPVFGHSETHVLLAPASVPLQRLLLSSLASQGQGLASGGGVHFEVWCRYYYPNVRDQLAAKGTLPLSKLCAMVTMQRQQPDETAVFTLPLVPVIDSTTGQYPQPSGLLEVCVHYKQRPMRSEVPAAGGRLARAVTLVVQVHRASGLQAAARALAERDQRLQYFAEVGVNAYVTVQLSLLPDSERRSSRVAARTFCPEFDFQTEIPLVLHVQRASGESCSLAELLEEASAVFTVWNRDARRVMDPSKSTDTVLGTVKIPLGDLIHKRTGISGWFGLYVPHNQDPPHQRHISVGGLELSMGFAHHADRERAVSAARSMGWEAAGCANQEDGEEEEEGWLGRAGSLSLSVSVPRAWLPAPCLLLPGHSQLQRSTYCYFRYRLYDQEAFNSQMRHPALEGEEGLASVAFPGSRTMELRSSQPLLWYLREERLEVQLWVAFGKERAQRPSDRDRLVGSAFVDLASLATGGAHKRTLSGVYPMFRRSAPDLHGAALRVHIIMTTESAPSGSADGREVAVDDSQGALLSEEEEEEVVGRAVSPVAGSHVRGGHHTEPPAGTGHLDTHLEESFAVAVTVDRAMHLSLKGGAPAEQGGGPPRCCVSYVTADSAEPVSTAIVASECPVWNHQRECRLSKQLLVDPHQCLVFKVWHKGEVEESLVGFASVDLSPLLSGFQTVCGWYHITDFGGQCQGQLKVSVSPLSGVQELRGQRRALNVEGGTNSSAVFSTASLGYQTTARYSSFPAHISRYPEQISSSPDQTLRQFSERSNESDRHHEHMDNVRLYHQSLQEQTGAEGHPSSSILFSALRKNLSELDDIQRYFSHKLSAPAFPPPNEQASQARLHQHSHSETDTCQLLLKSSQLVGEVNSLLTGLQAQCGQTVPVNRQHNTTTSPIGEARTLRVIPDTDALLVHHEEANFHKEEESPPPSPTSSMLSENRAACRDEEEHDGAATLEEVEEEESDEGQDYEETVVEPRPLNEVTSLTDRTSPWTSIVSDGNLGSLESLELQEGQPDLLTPGEDVLHAPSPSEERASSSGPAGESESSGSDRSVGSVDNVSDTDTEGERTLRAPDEDAVITNAGFKAPSVPSSPLPPTNPHGCPCSPAHDEEQQPKPSPTEIPNFFLAPHHLEASMRALRLAPCFSQPPSGPAWRCSGDQHKPLCHVVHKEGHYKNPALRDRVFLLKKLLDQGSTYKQSPQGKKKLQE